MNCFFMAENMYSLPAAIVTGFDGSHICSTTMGVLLEKVGAPDKLIRVEPEGGHGSTKWTEAEVDKWAAEQRLNPYPKRVHVSTSTLTYNKFYWVEVDELERQNHFATMRVDALDDNRIEVETKGIARFTLVSLDQLTEAGKPVTVEIDDVALPAALPRDGELSFAKRADKWAVTTSRHEPGLVKKNGLCGPMLAGWVQKSIHVIGTLGGPDETARLRDMMAAEVRHLRNDNCGYRSMDYAVKYDTQVTPEDIRDCNLILWGNNKTHSLIAKINSQLPVKLDGHKVIAGETAYDYDDVALAMIYPNPLNPERYVMIYSGNVWLARGLHWDLAKRAIDESGVVDYFKIDGSYPNLPDYFIFRQNHKGLGTAWGSEYRKFETSTLDAGFFDGKWQLSDDDTFHFQNPLPQKNAPFTPIKVRRPPVASAVVDGVTDQATPPRMTETPGVLDLGYASQQDGLQYHLSAAHHGRYFYREFGSVFTSPGKLVILEVQVENVGKPDDFVYPAMAVNDTPMLSVGGKTIAPFSVTMQHTLPGDR